MISPVFKKTGPVIAQGLVLLALICGFYFAVTLISSASFDLAATIYTPFRYLDPDNCFLRISIHHVVQGVIAFVCVFLLSRILKMKLYDFGFNRNRFLFAVRRILLFSGFWFVIQLSLSILLARTTSMDIALSYPLTARNFIGNFAFEVLLSGTSEEILFRALAIPFMVCVLRKFVWSEKIVHAIAASAATLVFMLAHINFNLHPFRVTHYNLAQQMTCLVFGQFFGYLQIKTNSVLGPMLAHNILNGVITVVTLITQLAF